MSRRPSDNRGLPKALDPKWLSDDSACPFSLGVSAGLGFRAFPYPPSGLRTSTMVKRDGIRFTEGTDELERETMLPKGVTKALLFFGPLSSGAFLLRPRTPVEVLLFGSVRLTLAPPQGAMVRPMDSMLKLPLGGGMMATGSTMSALTLSSTNSLVGKDWLAGAGIPSRAKVELEPVYKARMWLAMGEFERGEERCLVMVW